MQMMSPSTVVHTHAHILMLKQTLDFFRTLLQLQIYQSFVMGLIHVIIFKLLLQLPQNL